MPDGANVDRDSFREAMSRLGAAVHVITTDGPAGQCGFTASSVCSVTDNPPTVLVCLNRSSAMNAVFKENGVFCVNTLAAGQEEISNMFAGLAGVPMEQRFAAGRWQSLATGAPTLLSALVTVDCAVSSIAEVGTHSVFFGEVSAIRIGAPDQALIYRKRTYHTV